jgi:hypothetical protein
MIVFILQVFNPFRLLFSHCGGLTFATIIFQYLQANFSLDRIPQLFFSEIGQHDNDLNEISYEILQIKSDILTP